MDLLLQVGKGCSRGLCDKLLEGCTLRGRRAGGASAVHLWVPPIQEGSAEKEGLPMAC